jgi:stalled ribosome rescue protein Dom34
MVKIMKNNAGLWIDRANAVIVLLKDGEEEIKHIDSDTRNHPHSNEVADNIRLSVEKEYLKQYYDEIIECVSEAESVFIFGPGEAKDQLKKRFEANGQNGKTVIVETSDKMTEPQIAAKVRDHFLNHRNATN